MIFLRLFKHLLPRSRAWSLTVDKPLRQFFTALGSFGVDAREEADLTWLDVTPDDTRTLAEWEEQFALPSSGLSEAVRRARLAATWKDERGQSPRRLQDTLQAAGFDVYIHEWWEPISGRPGGGSVNGDETPTARNPFTYLDDGAGADRYVMNDGGADAQDGDSEAQDGRTNTPLGYPLVNKILQASESEISDGSAGMQDGGLRAVDGNVTVTYSLQQYAIPTDSTTYPYFLYIGGEAFPETANVPQSRRDEFEDLCLKICPTEQWLGILVTYS